MAGGKRLLRMGIIPGSTYPNRGVLSDESQNGTGHHHLVRLQLRIHGILGMAACCSDVDNRHINSTSSLQLINPEEKGRKVVHTESDICFDDNLAIDGYWLGVCKS